MVTLEVASDRPVAQVSARLSEVRADGAVALVSYGILNLTHDETHERVTPLVPSRAGRRPPPAQRQCAPFRGGEPNPGRDRDRALADHMARPPSP